MRIFMQTRPEADGQPRYCQLVLDQDLFGGWTLYREWGQSGGRVSTRREVYLDQTSAISAFEQARDNQLKRGLRIMFSQGG